MKIMTVNFVSEFESDTLTKFTVEVMPTRVKGYLYGRVTHAGELVHVTGISVDEKVVIGQALKTFHGILLDEAVSKECWDAYLAEQQ